MKKEFIVLNKGEKYYWRKKRNVLGRGIYTGRFFNNAIKQWAYCFESLDNICNHTLYTDEGFNFYQLT